VGSLNDFWDTSQRANDFLRTGRTGNAGDILRNQNDSFLIVDTDDNWVGGAPTGGNGGDNLGTGSPCTGSTQCPSGWACIDGICQQGGNSGGSGGGGNQGQPGPGGGDCDPDDPESPCNTGGPGSCQQAPGCGDNEQATDCCGTRCCSFGSSSSSRPGVHCWCGPCPPWPTCSDFCEAYLKANGEPGPGCSEGRDGNSCDSCSYCQGGQCVKDLPSFTPCWCEGNECNGGNCQKCETDPESRDYGECTLDASNCQQCATITNHKCPCGRLFTGPVVLPPITVCKPYGAGGLLPINLAQQEAARRCNEICSGDDVDPDPCTPKTGLVNRCCFADTGCRNPKCGTGQETVGSTVGPDGLGCVTCKVTFPLPSECEPCDCNCDNDCPNCQLCGADGKCYPDPACEDDEDLMVRVVETQTVYTGNWMCSVLVEDNPSCMGEWVQQSEPSSVTTREYTLTKQSYDGRQTIGNSGPDSGNACATAPRYTSIGSGGQQIYWYGSGTAPIGGECPLSTPELSCPNNAPGTNVCSTFNPQGNYSVYSTSVSYFRA